ncbi:flagellar hook protein FlgE [Oleiphilus messinensis]|uniref:Flagellar hook protein FlgE n=1 Tax=Oleiphilus messinensis TaxID=141451 RepID=A0A1Y0I613_9GAMM|nr:hypothetical protein [Oleiphilus messinensis]ARU55927.1 flagellar hook protein FlgE [Oleiphilus messinensis]
MSVSLTLQTGVTGVQKSISGMEQAAQKVAASGSENVSSSNGALSSPADIVEPLVELKLYEATANASAKVVKTADQALGTLLDINA